MLELYIQISYIITFILVTLMGKLFTLTGLVILLFAPISAPIIFISEKLRLMSVTRRIKERERRKKYQML